MMRIPLKEMMAVSQNPGCPKLGVFRLKLATKIGWYDPTQPQLSQC
jgi:hypothetical protein